MSTILSHPVRIVERVTVHQYEAQCECGAAWRLTLELDEDTEPMATCTNCGSDTFNLTDIGEIRNAGRGST